MNIKDQLLKIAEELIEELKEYFSQDERMLKILNRVKDIYSKFAVEIDITSSPYIRFSGEEKYIDLLYNINNDWSVIVFYSKDKMEYIPNLGYGAARTLGYSIDYETIEEIFFRLNNSTPLSKPQKSRPLMGVSNSIFIILHPP